MDVQEIIQLVGECYSLGVQRRRAGFEENPLTVLGPRGDNIGRKCTHELKERAEIGLQCFKEMLTKKGFPKSQEDNQELLDELRTMVESEYDRLLDHVRRNVNQKRRKELVGGARQVFTEQEKKKIASTMSRELQLYLDLQPVSEGARQTEKVETQLAPAAESPSKADERMTELLKEKPGLNQIAKSYIREAYRTDEAGCFRATAVMVGCAAESLTLELRDKVVDKMKTVGTNPPKRLLDGPILTVIEELERQLDSKEIKKTNRLLGERYAGYWRFLTEQIRLGRNEAGHPNDANEITKPKANRCLQNFPELAVLIRDLRNWIKNSYNPHPGPGRP